MKNDLIEDFLFDNEKSSLKRQAKLVDDCLRMTYMNLASSFTDLGLSMSGSVLDNSFSISCDPKVKKDVLSKRDVKRLMNYCSECRMEYPDFVKEWMKKQYEPEDKVEGCD